MGSDFDMWWEQNADLWSGILGLRPTLQLKAMAKIIWDDARQNTPLTKGLSFCKDCGGPYSLHHDCVCGACNG